MPNRAEGHFCLAIFAAALLSVLLRLRFVFAPIGTDEGGYLAVARAWGHGARLYRDVWVDRPQGLLLLYRLYDATIGAASMVRVLALLFGVVAVVAVALGVRAVAGPRSGVAAAVLVAAMSASPAIEGFQANGELLGGAMSAVTVAVACGVLVGRLGERWMYVAGLAGAVGITFKQSSIDGVVAVAVLLLLSGAGRRLLRLMVGAAGVLAAAALHGALTGWAAWEYAIWGYRLEKRSALESANWHRLWQTGIEAGPVFIGVALVVMVLVVARRPRGHQMVFAIWPFAALLGFVLGGQFFQHYWVSLAIPIGALGGMLIGERSSSGLRRTLLGAVLAPMMVSFVLIARHPNDTVNAAISGDTRSYRAAAAGEWLAAHHEPGDTLYVMCASANLYAYAHMDPQFRYLWFDGVHQGRGSSKGLETLLAGDHPPTWVAEVDHVSACTSSAAVARAIGSRYHRVVTVLGISILLRNDS